MREFTRQLTSGVQDQLAATGNYVYLKSAFGPIRVITESGDEVTLEQGQGIRFVKDFNHVQVLNSAEIEQKFTVLIGRGEYQNNALVGTVGTNPRPGVELIGLPQFLIDEDPQVIPSNSQRRQLIIRAATSNVGLVWIGSPMLEQGLPLAAGDVAELDISGDLNLIGSNEGDVLYLAEVLG